MRPHSSVLGLPLAAPERARRRLLLQPLASRALRAVPAVLPAALRRTAARRHRARAALRRRAAPDARRDRVATTCSDGRSAGSTPTTPPSRTGARGRAARFATTRSSSRGARSSSAGSSAKASRRRQPRSRRRAGVLAAPGRLRPARHDGPRRPHRRRRDPHPRLQVDPAPAAARGRRGEPAAGDLRPRRAAALAVGEARRARVRPAATRRRHPDRAHAPRSGRRPASTSSPPSRRSGGPRRVRRDPSTLCTTCDQRSQCPAYADMRAGKREHAGAAPEDLPAVAREREELGAVIKALVVRKDELDGILRAELEHQPELVLDGRRYTLNVALYKEYPLEPTRRRARRGPASRARRRSRGWRRSTGARLEDARSGSFAARLDAAARWTAARGAPATQAARISPVDAAHRARGALVTSRAHG